MEPLILDDVLMDRDPVHIQVYLSGHCPLMQILTTFLVLTCLLHLFFINDFDGNFLIIHYTFIDGGKRALANVII